MDSPVVAEYILVGESLWVMIHLEGELKSALFLETNALTRLILHVFVVKQFTSGMF